MIYRIFAVLAVIAVIVGSVLLTGQQREASAPTTVEEPMRDPGYAARNANLVQTGPDGHPLYTLSAALIRQLPGKGTVDLERVQLGFRDSSGDQWSARAEHGELGENTGQVELTGDVHVASVLPGSQAPAEIVTQRLSFDTHAEIVSTKDAVTLAWSGHQLNAQGLLASLKERHLQLESAVHGSFSP